MTDHQPPFLAGQAAFRAGRSILDNPHPPKMAEGDDYPGDWKNWRDGWTLARRLHENDGGQND